MATSSTADEARSAAYNSSYRQRLAERRRGVLLQRAGVSCNPAFERPQTRTKCRLDTFHIARRGRRPNRTRATSRAPGAIVGEILRAAAARHPPAPPRRAADRPTPSAAPTSGRQRRPLLRLPPAPAAPATRRKCPGPRPRAAPTSRLRAVGGRRARAEYEAHVGDSQADGGDARLRGRTLDPRQVRAPESLLRRRGGGRTGARAGACRARGLRRRGGLRRGRRRRPRRLRPPPPPLTPGAGAGGARQPGLVRRRARARARRSSSRPVPRRAAPALRRSPRRPRRRARGVAPTMRCARTSSTWGPCAPPQRRRARRRRRRAEPSARRWPEPAGSAAGRRPERARRGAPRGRPSRALNEPSLERRRGEGRRL